MTTHEYQRDEYPYRYHGDTLKVAVTDLQLDGSSVDFEQGVTEFRLFEHEEQWDQATLEIEVTVDQETLDYVFPTGDDDRGLILEGYAPETHSRFVEVVEVGDLDGGTYEHTYDFNCDEFHGRVGLEPLLIRSDHRSVDDEYANQSGRILAHGPYVDVYLDSPRLSLSGDLPVIPADFSDPTNPGTEGTEWHVDVTDASEPKLYLNEAYPSVVSAINSIERPTKRGLVGRITLEHLAVSMLTQFTIKAASHAVIKGEIDYDWQRTLLTDLCSEYFTEGTIEEFEESLETEALPSTIGRIETIYQRRQQPQKDVKQLLQML